MASFAMCSFMLRERMGLRVKESAHSALPDWAVALQPCCLPALWAGSFWASHDEVCTGMENDLSRRCTMVRTPSTPAWGKAARIIMGP